MNKQQIITQITNYLSSELTLAINAASTAHSDATDDQSVAETQYDTLAIEASYLAEGQSKRVQEYQEALKAYQQLNLPDFDQNTPIGLAALVQLSKDQACKTWFFIGPFAGGFRCKIDDQLITVITPASPMGQALKDKYQDDDIEIQLGYEKLADYICSVK